MLPPLTTPPRRPIHKPTMPPRRQRIKPEPANVLGDYPTPAESAYTARTVTPRREYEEIDLTSDDDSPAKSFKTQLTEDEGYASRAHQQHRSTSGKMHRTAMFQRRAHL